MPNNYLRFTRAAFLVVAVAFLIYNIYQAIVTSMIVAHFPLIIERLPNFFQSTNPTLQLALFLTQEVSGSIGAYIRLTGAIFAVSCAILFYRGKPTYLKWLSKALLFESIYFLLYIPVVLNHLVGSIISTSSFLNFNTGLSYLLQIVLIFPPYFILSQKLQNGIKITSIIPWAIVALSLYFFGMWIKHGFMWVYGVLPMQTQPTLIESVGAVNSLLTLLLAAIISSIAWFIKKTGSRKANFRFFLVSSSMVIAGIFFVFYNIISIFSSIFGAYILLTDAWMITLFVLGIALFYDNKNKAITNTLTVERLQD